MVSTLLFEGENIPVFQQESVGAALRRGGIPLAMECGGRNRCGRCRITLKSGTFVIDGKIVEISAAGPVTVNACAVRMLGSRGTAEFPAGGAQASPQDGPDIVLPVRLRPVFSGTAVALDLGTTNVAAALIENGRIVRTAERINAQTCCGDNVIDRIAFAARPGGADELRHTLIDETVIPLIRFLTAAPEKISQTAVAGNTVMTHFFFGVDASAMGHAPYAPEKMHFAATAGHCGLAGIPAETPVFAADLVGGFIGGDISAGLTVSGFGSCEKRELYMDIGTNCEIVLNDRGSFTALSAAAGPAFERAGVRSTHGGNIRHIRFRSGQWILDPDIPAPAGFCGTGLIDLLAESGRNSFTDDFGKWRKDPALPANLALSDARTAELVTAKAAVESALGVLFRQTGVSPAGIDKVYLAGNFSEHLDIVNGIYTGLLPDLPGERFVKLGNASLAGAAAMLLDPEFRRRTEEWRRITRHTDPAEDPDYAKFFASAMRVKRGECPPCSNRD
ncbi:MAG: DUF4445 domain-containing protein [Lentisphaeria bacterium]|nr:DUF4445 domain-containing protein [Lentisphaeria bacterium]